LKDSRLIACKLAPVRRAEKKLAKSEVVERGMGWRMGQLLSFTPALFSPHPWLESLFTGYKAN